MQSSPPSTLHSEGIFNSVRFSGSYSSVFSSSHRRRPNDRSRRRDHTSRAPTPRSVDFTDVPKPDLNENHTYNSSSASSSSSSSRRRDGVVRAACRDSRLDHRRDGANPGVHSHAVLGSNILGRPLTVDQHASGSKVCDRVEVDNVVGKGARDMPPDLPLRPLDARVGEAAPSATHSTSASPALGISLVGSNTGGPYTPSSPSSGCLLSSKSPRAGGDSARKRGSDAPSSTSAALISDDRFATLSPEKVEWALQLYVERGGIRTSEVAAMLRALPWCVKNSSPTLSVSAVADLPTEDADEEARSRLLDPEAWLGAVAAATTSALVAADDETRAAAAAPSAYTSITPEGGGRPAQVQHKTPVKPSIRESQNSYLSEPPTPLPFGLTAERRRSSADLSSEVAAAAAAAASPPPPEGTLVSHRAHLGRRGSSDDVSRRDSRFCPGGSDSEDGTPKVSALGCHRVSTGHRLTFADATDNCAPRVSSLARGSSSHIGVLNQTTAVQHSHQQSPPSSSRIDGMQPPPHSTLNGSPSPVQRSADSQRWFRVAASTFSLPPSPMTAMEKVAGASEPWAASMFTEASTRAAGMRTLFQLCLQPARRTASATLTVGDWEALVDQLRHDGHHKLPPQPILDDIACTIERTILSEGRTDGLTLSDFTRVIQGQLEEVWLDMTSPVMPDTAAGNRVPSRQAHALRFPSHPNYSLKLQTYAATSTQPHSSPSSCTSQCSSQMKRAPVSASMQWRVLPTWCMALAGFFPEEVSTLCSLPVVFYLRSIRLIQAVLEAIAQRLQLELDSMRECVAPVTGAASKRTQHRSKNPGVESSIWPLSPERSRAGGLMNISLALSGGSVDADLRSSLPIAANAFGTSGDRDGACKEQPVWGSTTAGIYDRNARHHKSPVAASMAAALGRGGGGDDALVVTSGSLVNTSEGARPDAELTASAATDSVEPHYLLQRPLDEISASAVARAKARRLMDTLRRHTVPINRYECFARVEQEDKQIDSALCFVTERELAATLGYDGDEDTDDDSDAIPDMVATLTYDPVRETVVSPVSAGARAGDDVGVDQTGLSSRPPIMPRMHSSDVLPTVVMSATRVARRVGRRGPAGGSAPLLTTSMGANGAVGSPPSAPCMFRMSGVLSTVLPRNQEKAMVNRLSKPVYDPAAMSLRAFSRGGTHMRSHAAGTTTTTTATPSTNTPVSAPVNSRTSENCPNRSVPSKPCSGPVIQNGHSPHPCSTHHQSSKRMVSRSGSALLSRGSDHRSRSRLCATHRDRYCTSIRPRNRYRPPSPQCPPASVASSSMSGSGCVDAPTLHVSDERTRSFFFDVPSVLVESPLSVSAAAAAAAQVIDGGTASTLSRSATASSKPRVPRRPASHCALSRSASRPGSAAPPRAGIKGRSTVDRGAESLTSSVVAKLMPCDSRPRKRTPPAPGAGSRCGRLAVHPRKIESSSRPIPADAATSVHPCPSPSRAEPRISLYERRLMRRLQLAYAHAHPYENAKSGNG
ncbi:hypothetical protein JKF63_05083 [Porcisia hertigi]|uniref:Uncharacterized protein n=1 Tax=Porcisia hertigi TaxID=2761500 RepID=A0A836LCV7_9TRYP|nr:hypothetical protein JKF63_05083 [Porcisia hertigi]